jgi:predicted DNA-binding protein
MPKKSSRKVASKRADQYMLRFSEGMRDRLAKLAGANGRSMNAEILEAIEKHLEGTDRITQIWQFVEKHRENIEALPRIWAAVENIEIYLERSAEGESPAGLRMWRQHKEHQARVASLPPISAEQAAVIRRLIQETEADEARLLKLLGAPTVEEIKDFDRVVSILEQRRRADPPA